MIEPSALQALPGPIDPLAPVPPGRYDDDLVTVRLITRPDGPAWPAAVPDQAVRTGHFLLAGHDRRIEVSHWLTPGELDNDIAGLLADELFAPGWLSGTEVFERLLTGVVLSAVEDPLAAWHTFYDNTLDRTRQCWREPGAAPGPGPDTIAGFAPVYAHALRLIPAGPVLDVGSCFGFLPLLLAERAGNSVTASDLSGGSMRLLAAVTAGRGPQLSTLVCDAARIPVPDGSAETVSVIHLLEHLTPGHAAAVLREALRVARRKVVVAVPFEAEAGAVYGHIRTLDLAALRELGAASGAPWSVHEHHGGWLELAAG